MAEVSVVIPVYNVEDYLEECLDSIVNQTFEDLEIICVNDGSKDDSLKILKEYAEKDDRIIIFDQENGGHAVATNVGIEKATGKYLFLMDSDDKLKLDAIELAYNAAEEKKVDFVLFKAINYDDEKDEFYETENYSMNAVADFVGENIFSFDDLGDLSLKIAVTPWTKLYNREFIEKSGVKFAEGLIFEDNIFFWEVLIQAKRIYFLKKHLFYRRWYKSSSTMAGDLRFTDSIAINTMIIDVFEKYGKLNETFKVRLYNRKVSLSFLRFTQIKEEFKEIFFDELQKNFMYWVVDNDFYEYLQSIMTPRNKFILNSVLKSKTAKELEYLVENYDLEIIDKNDELSKKNDELAEIIENLKNTNDSLLNSNSWKVTKPLRTFNKILKCSRLNDNSVVDAIESIRDIFKDLPDFLRRLENYISLKFNHIPEVNKLISWPKVSVLMEVSNSEKFFEKCLNSLIDQKINDFELLLINGFKDDVKYDYIKDLLKKEDWVKFIETEDMLNLNIVLNNTKGDYVYFCDDSYIFENNLFEDMLETSLMTGSDICLCNTPEGGEHKNQELNIKSILGNHNYPHYLSDWQEIIPHIFSSHFELPSMLYKKSLIQEISNSEELISDRSVLQIKSVLSTSKLSFVDKFLFNYQTKNDCYYTSRLPKNIDDALDIFTICDDVERFLKEKSLYDDLKTNFDIYKINQISSYLDYVRFVGCYSYNDPENRDLYANNAKILDYSQYYGSKSENIGLNYSFANEYFTKAKYEFDKLDYRDLKFRDLKNNEFSDEDMLNIYAAVLKSSSYEEYINIVNLSVVEKLRAKNIELKQKINDYKTKNDDDSIENKLSQLKDENKILRDENNQLRNEYWENREEYEYILGSKSWKYTEWLRRK